MNLPTRLTEFLRRATLVAALVAYAVPGLAAASGGLCISGDGSLMPACSGALADRLAGVRAHEKRDGDACRCCERAPEPKRGCCGSERSDTTGDSGSREPGCVDVPAPDVPSAPSPAPNHAVPEPSLASEPLSPAMFVLVASAPDVPSPVADPPPRTLAFGRPFFLRV